MIERIQEAEMGERERDAMKMGRDENGSRNQEATIVCTDQKAMCHTLHALARHSELVIPLYQADIAFNDAWKINHGIKRTLMAYGVS